MKQNIDVFDFTLTAEDMAAIEVLLIPKTTHTDRMKENIDIFDFELSPGEMAEIETLDTGASLFFSHYDPKTVEWFMSIL